MYAIQSIRSRLVNVDKHSQDTLVHFINKWIRHSGEEWTVSRLKDIKIFFLTLLANPSKDPRSLDLPFVKKAWDGLPRGPFTFLSNFFRNGDVKNLLMNLQIYTAFIKGGKASPKQLMKFYSSVKAKPLQEKDYLEWLLTLEPDLDKFNLPSSRESRYKFETYNWSPTRKSLDPQEWISKPEGDLGQLYWLKSKVAFNLTGYGKTVHSQSAQWASRLLQTTTDIAVDYFQQDENVDVVGRISYLQEPGFKLRAIANPGRPFQLALNELGQLFFDQLRKIENDFTFDQKRGVKLVVDALRADIHVSSIDLSDATNTFPFIYTKRIIQKLSDKDNAYTSNHLPKNKQTAHRIFYNGNGHFLLWERLCRAKWLTPEGDKVRWTKGQPLGLYPSFAAFALSHHALVRSLWNWLGRPRSVLGLKYPYVILGDDIVIFDKGLDSLYRNAINKLDCKISESKTFSSKSYAEFAGSHITKNIEINPGKWRIISDDNFLDFLRNVGPSGLKHLRLQQREVAEVVKSLPEPIGLGWNPKGLSLDERLSEFSDLYWSQVNVSFRGNHLDNNLLLALAHKDKFAFLTGGIPLLKLSKKDLLINLYRSTERYIKVDYSEEYRRLFNQFLTIAETSSDIDMMVNRSLQQFAKDHTVFKKWDHEAIGQAGIYYFQTFWLVVEAHNYSASRDTTLLQRLRNKLGL